ncbi:MAG: TetR/AcrR family transcriptional regulator [Muribaculaceae bacterium]|nr:TetR/AcrR family transcriptional regulator [Muribaculaceae bacterium]
METKENILIAAEELFLEKGFDGTRTDEISKRAGTNHALLHYYFRSKTELFNVVLRKSVTELTNALIAAFSDMPEGIDGILEAMTRHYDILRRKPGLPKFIVNEIYSRQDRIGQFRELIEEKTARVIEKLRASLENEGCEMKAETLLTDIIILNSFPFLTSAIHYDRDAFLDARLEENIILIKNRISK